MWKVKQSSSRLYLRASLGIRPWVAKDKVNIKNTNHKVKIDKLDYINTKNWKGKSHRERIFAVHIPEVLLEHS
jgi:hypothetical protein